MSTTLAVLLKDPAAPLVIEAAQTALADEKKRRAEFRDWVTEEVKAEFINGEIFMHSPVKRRHRLASGLLFQLVNIFTIKNKLGETATEKAMISLTRNDYEPDVCFWSTEKAAHFHADTMLHPAPDFVVEVLSKRTSKNDRTTKFQDYARHGIREYWIIDPIKKTVEQYGLLVPTDREYLLYGKFGEGEAVSSIAIAGLTVEVAAIFDEAANLKALADLLQS